MLRRKNDEEGTTDDRQGKYKAICFCKKERQKICKKSTHPDLDIEMTT